MTQLTPISDQITPQTFAQLMILVNFALLLWTFYVYTVLNEYANEAKGDDQAQVRREQMEPLVDHEPILPPIKKYQGT